MLNERLDTFTVVPITVGLRLRLTKEHPWRERRSTVRRWIKRWAERHGPVVLDQPVSHITSDPCMKTTYLYVTWRYADIPAHMAPWGGILRLVDGV